MSRYGTGLTGMAVVMLLAGWVAAQPADRPFGPPPGRPPMADPLIKALDANKDGQLSAEEVTGAAAVLEGLDANDDGQLTPEEFLPPRPRSDHGTQGQRPLPPEGQDGDKGPRGHRPPPLSPIVRALDADRNGVISAEEIAGAAEALKILDNNKDGVIDRAELRPLPPPNPLMQALDANRDGELSAEEIANAATVLKQLDKNGDGKVGRDELAPPPPPGGRPGARHGPASQGVGLTK